MTNRLGDIREFVGYRWYMPYSYLAQLTDESWNFGVIISLSKIMGWLIGVYLFSFSARDSESRLSINTFQTWKPLNILVMNLIFIDVVILKYCKIVVRFRFWWSFFNYFTSSFYFYPQFTSSTENKSILHWSFISKYLLYITNL